MQKLYLYNTLSRKKEEFIPINKSEIGLYTCGPTVYNYAHIGNLRTYIFEDILKRVLKYNGYKVKHVMNITDVGHLTGDMDMGEDKMEKTNKNALYLKCENCGKDFFSGIINSGSGIKLINNKHQCEHCNHVNLAKNNSSYFKKQKINKNVWEIAKFYEEAFINDLKHLNIKMPDEMPKATEYIQEQIDLIKILEKKGFTYKISDGVYYDTSKFKDYNKLSHLDLETLREGARVEKNEEKKNPTDFALWKFSPKYKKRQMEWNSPWGIGFPGWHIECSAMSMALLKEKFDIHCGGIDHINVHHTNEIAQSEAATGKHFFNYWMHGAFFNIKGGKKMAKSAGNFLTLQNTFIEKGMDPLVYRFAALQTHYRKPMEYSEKIMKNAENGFKHLVNQIRESGIRNPSFAKVSAGKQEPRIMDVSSKYKENFLDAVNDDLNMPKALAVLQEVLKSDLSGEVKLATVLDFDKVLGLKLDEAGKVEELSAEVKELIKIREKARVEKNWGKSDKLREKIEKLGYTVEDSKEETKVYKK